MRHHFLTHNCTVIPHTKSNEDHSGRSDFGNAQDTSRKLIVTSLNSTKLVKSGSHEGTKPSASDRFGSQSGPLRHRLNLFGTALAVFRIISAKLSTDGRTTTKSSAIPALRKRIEDSIDHRSFPQTAQASNAYHG
ncbi:unnamed protein product [Parnassius apollo]|uniref:(apollo) hypothetical protein n=1 Tax=Parnassius apollo TaxID=110799 RepID=A0A8S3Y7B0_PARAO|nr:unnamed protein product [Parnassius apollo]